MHMRMPPYIRSESSLALVTAHDAFGYFGVPTGLMYLLSRVSAQKAKPVSAGSSPSWQRSPNAGSARYLPKPQCPNAMSVL